MSPRWPTASFLYWPPSAVSQLINGRFLSSFAQFGFLNLAKQRHPDYSLTRSSEQLPSLVPHHHPPQSPMVLHHPQLILDHRSHIVKKDPPIVFPKRFAISLQAQNFILGCLQTEP
ncbi:hypothetical protein PGT21_009559 [Puccinia graminis f. sp. tritici]|uniref:Uncharacterized protein n=1 Tax=Puccinia graminis f. sp. tritici TaxID=56615 RepID=A0A5B0LPM3_PUCGR|nr:hypothetical protein PGT21_009559 [Puccinia graminis f. sp. tritici]